MLVVTYLNPLWSLTDYLNDHLHVYSIDDLKVAKDFCEDILSNVFNGDVTSPLPPKKEPLSIDAPVEPLKARRATF